SVTGDDAEGARLRECLQECGVMTQDLLNDPTRRTLAKHRVIAGSQMVVRFDQGSTIPLSADVERVLINRLRTLWPVCDAVAVSDYGCGIVTPGVIRVLAEFQA